MESSETIGQRIKSVRGELSQKAFGVKIGLSQTAVTALETGKSEPSLSTFNSIIDAFKVSPEWLRVGSGQMRGTPTQLTTGEETVAEGETLLALAVSEAKNAEKDKEIQWLRGIVGKESDSSDAADDADEAPVNPDAPIFSGGAAPKPMLRKRVGFAPSYVTE